MIYFFNLGLILGGYLMGSIPFGFIISGVFYQTDIRQVGSGNPGATNVWRVFGPVPGLATLILDIGKGVIPVLASRLINHDVEIWSVLIGLAAIIGHNWSVFMNFKGGKGVATSAGVFLTLAPLHTGLALFGFAIALLIFKRVSIGSMVGTVILFSSTFIYPVSNFLRFVIFAVAIMVLIKHIANIRRLMAGTEPKVGFKK